MVTTRMPIKRPLSTHLIKNKLIIMLYDGAIKNASFAVEHMKSGQIEKVHDCLIKTKNIVTELMATLNMDRGGDIANNLQSLYSYMFSQLIEANMNKKTEPVVVVIDLLKELRAAWTQINSKKKNDAKRQNTPGKGMMQNNQENAEKRISVTG